MCVWSFQRGERGEREREREREAPPKAKLHSAAQKAVVWSCAWAGLYLWGLGSDAAAENALKIPLSSPCKLVMCSYIRKGEVRATLFPSSYVPLPDCLIDALSLQRERERERRERANVITPRL